MFSSKKTERQYSSVKDAFLQMGNFCAYQERSQQEVRDKLYEKYVFNEEEVEFIIARLIEEGYVNEERFAKIYAGSKFRVKKWGRLKIRQALKQQGISDYCIRQGMAEIDDEAYEESLHSLLEKKNKLLSEKNPLKRKQALLRYALGKGYESDLVWATLETLLENS